MDKSKIIIVTIAIGAVIIIGGVYLLSVANLNKTDLTGGNSNQAQVQENANANKNVKVNDPTAVKSVESATKSVVPVDTKIPEVGEKTDSSIAVPLTVVAAAPGVEAKFRSFNVTGDKGVFTPSTVIAKKGDTVHINFLAVDKDYDITFPDYGMKQIAKKGESKVLEFQAVTEGKFAYYCDICGGLNGTAKGYIIVAP